MRRKKIIILFVSLVVFYQISNAQKMKNDNRGEILSKKEVQKYIESGEAVYDAKQSSIENLQVYRFTDGRLLYKRDDGKGALWKSEKQVENLMEETKGRVSVLSFIGWIAAETNLDSIQQAAFDTLQKHIGISINYSSESLNVVSKIKIKDVVKEKELLYAIIIYSCDYYARAFGGKISKEVISNDTNYFSPIVVTEDKKVYSPYSEYLKSFSEPPQLTIKQSIDIERNKYKFFN